MGWLASSSYPDVYLEVLETGAYPLAESEETRPG
jgi:hypothetical protein